MRKIFSISLSLFFSRNFFLLFGIALGSVAYSLIRFEYFSNYRQRILLEQEFFGITGDMFVSYSLGASLLFLVLGCFVLRNN